MTASFYQTQELLLIIHDEPMAIADNTEALADEEALLEILKLQLKVFPTYKVLMVVLTVIWKIVMVYQLVHAR